MDTTFELVRAARGLNQGRPDSLRDIFYLSVDDVFFQIQFVLCDENKINGELEDFYVKVAKSGFMLDDPNNIAEFLNETALNRTGSWVRNNLYDQLQTEKRGGYQVPFFTEDFLSGDEIIDVEYTKAMGSFICTFPEIFRQTALAFYYANLPMDKITDALMIDSHTVKARTTYIEKILSQKMHGYCKERGYQSKSVNPQRIRTAMFELAKMYRYPYKDPLFANIATRC